MYIKQYDVIALVESSPSGVTQAVRVARDAFDSVTFFPISSRVHRLVRVLASIAFLWTGAAYGQCGGDFAEWLDGVRIEASAQGVGEAAVKLLDSVRRSDKVLKMDASRQVFAQDWLTFAGRMVNAHRLAAGKSVLQRFADYFEQARQRFGVPAPVIAALWGLETDYGVVQGQFRTLDALATLAHDCRRPELFRPQLLDALRLIDHGLVEPKDLVGAWAGELGQMQWLPSDYLAFGTDGEGDGRVNLKHSEPDVIATAGRFLAHLGWRADEPWLEEVRVPDELPWQWIGVDISLPLSQWSAWGVRTAGGEPLPVDGPPASLLLPMGRKGPAFLAYPNFGVFTRWNQSLVYATTAAYFATRLAGAPRVESGDPEPGLSITQMLRLQQLLAARGYDVGTLDGILGARTRQAVAREQQRLGWPADAWPTPALLSRLESNDGGDVAIPAPSTRNF